MTPAIKNIGRVLIIVLGISSLFFGKHKAIFLKIYPWVAIICFLVFASFVLSVIRQKRKEKL